jgi:hypothetical protein
MPLYFFHIRNSDTDLVLMMKARNLRKWQRLFFRHALKQPGFFAFRWNERRRSLLNHQRVG